MFMHLTEKAWVALQNYTNAHKQAQKLHCLLFMFHWTCFLLPENVSSDILSSFRIDFIFPYKDTYQLTQFV